MSVQLAPVTSLKLPQSNEEWNFFFEFDPGSEADTTALVNAALEGLTKRIVCLASGSRAELRHVMKLLGRAAPSIPRWLRGLIGARLRPGILEAYAASRRRGDLERRHGARLALSHCGLDPDRMPHPRVITDVELAISFEDPSSTRH